MNVGIRPDHPCPVTLPEANTSPSELLVLEGTRARTCFTHDGRFGEHYVNAAVELAECLGLDANCIGRHGRRTVLRPCAIKRLKTPL